MIMIIMKRRYDNGIDQNKKKNQTRSCLAPLVLRAHPPRFYPPSGAFTNSSSSNNNSSNKNNNNNSLNNACVKGPLYSV